jgi:hypothetical protein
MAADRGPTWTPIERQTPRRITIISVLKRRRSQVRSQRPVKRSGFYRIPSRNSPLPERSCAGAKRPLLLNIGLLREIADTHLLNRAWAIGLGVDDALHGIFLQPLAPQHSIFEIVQNPIPQ